MTIMAIILGSNGARDRGSSSVPWYRSSLRSKQNLHERHQHVSSAQGSFTYFVYRKPAGIGKFRLQ